VLMRDVGCAMVFGLNVIGFKARSCNRMFAVSLPYLCCMFVVQLTGVLSVTPVLGEFILILLRHNSFLRFTCNTFS